jgi:N utilization substance protein A
MEVLNLEEILAQLLASEGFSSVESLAEADMKAVASVEGLDEEIAKELISRAKEYLGSEEETEIDSNKEEAIEK